MVAYVKLQYDHMCACKGTLQGLIVWIRFNGLMTLSHTFMAISGQYKNSAPGHNVPLFSIGLLVARTIDSPHTTLHTYSVNEPPTLDIRQIYVTGGVWCNLLKDVMPCWILNICTVQVHLFMKTLLLLTAGLYPCIKFLKLSLIKHVFNTFISHGQ